jgi:hypothetical protein
MMEFRDPVDQMAAVLHDVVDGYRPDAPNEVR